MTCSIKCSVLCRDRRHLGLNATNQGPRSEVRFATSSLSDMLSAQASACCMDCIDFFLGLQHKPSQTISQNANIILIPACVVELLVIN